jgi:hypothetical protein
MLLDSCIHMSNVQSATPCTFHDNKQQQQQQQQRQLNSLHKPCKTLVTQVPPGKPSLKEYDVHALATVCTGVSSFLPAGTFGT